MSRTHHIQQAIAILIGTVAAGGALAQAQNPPTDQPASGTPSATTKSSTTNSLERVEVTGSRIKRIDSETPAPVQVITREAIERSGALSVAEVLKRLPAANVGSFNENAVASFSPGGASASLRGLGAQATLVLINGRRVAPFGFPNGGQTTFVDINQIPLEVVERIEVLLDGASAIYGSDAIGGVINVILRKDYNGLVATGSYGLSTHGDAGAKRGTLTYGIGSLASDGYNAFATYEHVDQNPVHGNAREYTQNSDFRRFGLTDRRSSYSYPGNLYNLNATETATTTFVGPVAGCKPLNDPTAALNGACAYDFEDHLDLISKSKRDSLTVAGTADIGRGFQLFGDANFGRTKFIQEGLSYNTATYQSTGTLPTPFIVLGPDHPQNPTGHDVGIRYRFADVPATTGVKTDTERVVAGIRNPDFAGWDVESGLLYSHSKTTQATDGFLQDSVLANEVLGPDGKASNTFIFGNPGANDAGLISRLYPTLRNFGTTTTESVDLRGTREIYQLPAGAISVALGVEVRHEKYDSIPDPLVAAGDISVLGASSAAGSRSIQAGYAEFAIPVFRNFEASLAARVDHYSDFGTTTNPKLGFKWKILPQLALRGTYATGFRAPALTETTTTPTTGFFNGVIDPRNCPNPQDQTNPNCDVSVPATLSANPALKPEKSKSFTAGIIFEPLDNVSIAVDGFRIKRRNEITFVSIDYLLAHEDQYPGFVNRNPDGTINSFALQYTNLSSTKVFGYDVELKASQNVGEIGKFGVDFTYNDLPHYDASPVPGAAEVDFAGTYLQPKTRFQMGLTFDRGPWAASLNFNFVDSYSTSGSPGDACIYTNAQLCTIGKYFTTDLFLGYKGFKNLDLGLTITNLDNRQAPFDANASGFLQYYRSDYHSALGRYFQVGAKYKFF